MLIISIILSIKLWWLSKNLTEYDSAISSGVCRVWHINILSGLTLFKKFMRSIFQMSIFWNNNSKTWWNWSVSLLSVYIVKSSDKCNWFGTVSWSIKYLFFWFNYTKIKKPKRCNSRFSFKKIFYNVPYPA